MKEHVRALLAEYLKRYPEEAEDLASLAAQLALPGEAIFERSTMEGHLTSSVLVLDVPQQHILLIHHKAYERWLPAGGHYEVPGSLWDSGCREVTEETGLPTMLAHPALFMGEPLPLDIDTHPIAARPSKGEGPHRHHDFAFVAIATKTFEPVAQEAEVNGVKWLPLAEFANLPGRRIQRLARKLNSLLAHQEMRHV